MLDLHVRKWWIDFSYNSKKGSKAITKSREKHRDMAISNILDYYVLFRYYLIHCLNLSRKKFSILTPVFKNVHLITFGTRAVVWFIFPKNQNISWYGSDKCVFQISGRYHFELFEDVTRRRIHTQTHKQTHIPWTKYQWIKENTICSVIKVIWKLFDFDIELPI